MIPLIRALFVEDEPDIQFVVEMALGRTGRFELTTFASGVEALDAMSDHEGSFDFALVNVQLPAMSGIEFVRRIKRIPTFEDLPVIFVTASVSSRELNELRGDDILGVISKPFDATSLATEIDALLETR